MNEITQAALPAPVPTPLPVQPNAPIIPPSINTAPATTSPTTNMTSGWNQAFKKAIENPAPLIFGVLVTTALLYATYYYMYHLKMSKVFVRSVENKMDEIEMKQAEMESFINSVKEKEKNNEQQSNNTTQAFI